MYTNLYKGRYMIALYDEDDTLIDSFLNVREACQRYDLNRNNIMFIIGRMFKGEQTHTDLFGKKVKICFIDCLPQNDQFYEEDILFLKRFGSRSNYNKYEREIKENMEMAEM